MRTQGRTVEEKIAGIARCQHGVVTRAQLLAIGLTPGAIGRRVRRGLLIAVHRGVYRVGHTAPSVEARYLAAVLACGPGAVLCGRAAAHLHGLLRLKVAPPSEVLTLTERRIPGVITHRVRALDPADTTLSHCIPATSVPRTLVDLAAVLSAADLALACHEAGVRHKTTPAHVKVVLARRANAPGAGKLRAVLDGDVRVTLSKLERRFLERLRGARLPLPETNRLAGTKRVDCRWPRHRLTVELDSYRYHASRHAWEQDRRREREAYARGDRFRRFTWGDVFESSGQMIAELRVLLAPVPLWNLGDQ
jgi:very-short-patch-repair endonuclease